MRYWIFAAGLIAVSATAQDQASPWQFFQDAQKTHGLVVASVDSAEGGTQLYLKCDKTGKKSLYAMVYSETQLGRPSPIPMTGTVTYRFDDGSPGEDQWRLYEHVASAINTAGDRALPHLLDGLVKATKLEIRIKPYEGSPVIGTFNVTGAKDALAQVYDSCKDNNPYK